jgi:hypothetical protein
MGSILVDDIRSQTQLKDESFRILSTSQAKTDYFRSFEVVGLAPDPTATPTGMRDEILLLSWLIVLLRTHEDNQLGFGWSYQNRENGSEHEPTGGYLPMDEVMTGPQCTVEQAAVAISQRITKVASSACAVISSSLVLILGTNSPSEESQAIKAEVSK